MEEDDIFGRGSGEARDDISLLPRPVAVKASIVMFIVQMHAQGMLV